MVKAWKDVEASQEFKDLSREDRIAVRDAYWQEVVRPQTSEDNRASVYSSFLARSNASIARSQLPDAVVPSQSAGGGRGGAGGATAEERQAYADDQQRKTAGGRATNLARDLGLAAVRGAVQVPRAAVGLADVVTGGRAGKALEGIGYRPDDALQILNDANSQDQKDAQREFDQTDGILGKAGAALRNPRLIGTSVVESLPAMGAGGVIGRGVGALAPRVAPWAAGALGEGTVTAGQQAEDIRNDTADRLLSGKQAALAVGSGMATGALGAVANKVSGRLGIGDVDTMLAGGPGASGKGGVLKKMAGGAVSEGLLEEVPQSAQEQIAQNVATGKAWNDGLDSAIAMGAVTGGAMGAGAAPLHRSHAAVVDQVATEFGMPAKAAAAVKEQAAALPPEQRAGFVRRALDAMERRGLAKKAGAGAAFEQQISAQPEILNQPAAPTAEDMGWSIEQAPAEQSATAPGPTWNGQPVELAGHPVAGPDGRQYQPVMAGGRPQFVPVEELTQESQNVGADRALVASGAAEPGDQPARSVEDVGADGVRGADGLGANAEGSAPGLREDPAVRVADAPDGALIEPEMPPAAVADSPTETRPVETPTPKAEAAPFQTEEQARSYLSQQRRSGGSLRISAVPAEVDGGWALVSKGEPGFEEAQAAAQVRETQRREIDKAAHQAATSPKNDLAEPTQAQKEVGNYAKGHTNWNGLGLTIENPAGSDRSGVDPNGKPWAVKMPAHYGYIKRTEGADGDHVDIYMGPSPDSKRVFVVDQVDHETGKFDEHKVILGANDAKQAQELYDAGFSDGKGPQRRSAMTEMGVDEFKAWVRDGKKSEPVAAVSPRTTTAATNGAEPVITHVTGKGKELTGYVRKIDEAQAKAIDQGAFKKNGGWFLRKDRADAWADRSGAQGNQAPQRAAEQLPEQAPAEAPAAGWDGMSEDARLSVLTRAGYAKADGTPTLAAHGLKRKTLAGMGEATRAKVSAALGQAPASSPTAASASDTNLRGFNITDHVASVPSRVETSASARVAAKFRNPATGETWSGRGLQPKWIREALISGKSLSDLATEQSQPPASVAAPERTDPPVVQVAQGQEAPTKPRTQLEALTDLEGGKRILLHAGTDYETEVWIDRAKGATHDTYVHKSREKGSSIVITKGPVGADRQWGWGRHDAAREAIKGVGFDAKVEEKPEASPAATPAVEDVLDDELRDALGHLGDVLGDVFGAKLNITGPQHGAGDLLPALSKVVELLVRKGFRSFKASTGKAAQLMRSDPRTAAHVDSITPRQWKAAYNAIAEGHPGTDGEDVVHAMTSEQVREVIGAKPAPVEEAPKAADTSAKQERTDAAAARELDSAGAPALERVSADPVQGAGPVREARDGAARGGRGDIERDADAGGSRVQQDGGLGVGARGAPVPARRDGARRAGERGVRGVAGPESDVGQPQNAGGEGRLDPPQFESSDFTIEEDFALGEGGQRTKYKANIEAIRLVKDLDRTGRTATVDEQKILARYVGWGGIPQAFDPDNKDWAKQFAELKAELTPEDWADAAQSTQYAHYTSREIVTGMYRALDRMGFTGGAMLEAGGGVGNFIGLMPPAVRTNGKVTLVERDAISSAIAKHLYPKQNVRAGDFTEFGKGQDGQFDAQIGNPPFSATTLTDKSGRKHLSGLSVHNYFIAKGIDMLREGGISAVVVSNSFMDAKNDRARSYIADRARLLGAIRLPNDAFAKNAGTQVTTDIVFLQKLPESEWGSKAARADAKRWVGIESVADSKGGQDLALNSYFAANPDMMLGDWGRHGTMYGPDQPALVARPGQDTAALLNRAIAKLPEKVYTASTATKTKAMQEAGVEALHDTSVKEGGFYNHASGLWRRLTDRVGEAVAVKITPQTMWSAKTALGEKGYARIQRMAEMRATVRNLLAAEISDDPAMEGLRAKLNQQYEDYVAEAGPINDRATARLFEDDPDYPLLAALESDFEPGMGAAAAKANGIKPYKAKARKAAIFSRRVVESRKTVSRAESPADALGISMAERGRLDVDYIGKLLGRDPSTVLDELSSGDKPLLFKDPATGEHVLRDAYLSGNVRAKLLQAQRSGMTQNVRALEAVQPEDVPASQISARIGSPWVPVEVYESFASHLFGEGTKASVRYTALNSSFIGSITPASDAANTTTFGTPSYPGSDLLIALMNNREIKVTYKDADGKVQVDAAATEAANEKASEIKDKFQDWLFKDSDRAEMLVRSYNDANNNYVTRTYDGSWLTFPGKVPNEIIKFRRHQRNAIARTVQDRTALYDHTVGAGKTFTAIAAAMELKRTGLAKKPMIVVPNHLVKQWAADFYRLYPGANILTATKADFERANRRKFLAKIATGDWDAVIIAHSSFGFIKPAPEFEERFNTEQVAQIVATIESVDSGDGDKQQKKRTVKQLEKMKEKLENRIASLREKSIDDLLDLQQIGVDQLFVDEAHLFKNLMFSTKMQNVRGLGDSKGSKRAFDMYLKTRQIMEQNGRGQGVMFMTGTPVSNSLAEMYHMMRYLMPSQMKALGFDSFDAWANTYASVNQVWMQTASGNGFKAQNRMSSFDNVAELLKLFDQVSDTVTMDDIKAAFREENGGREFPLPALKSGRRQPVSLVKTDAQNAYMEEIAKRAQALEQRRGPPQKGDDNILVVMGDARKAAMDIRLVDQSATDREPGGRIDRAAGEIFDRWQKSAEHKGTQLVFSDMGTPLKSAARELAEYNELQARLAPLQDEELRASADLGDEQALAKLAAAEEAQAEMDAKGADWLGAIQAAMRGFSVYDDLKAALVERGIPADQVAFIHDFNTDDQKAALFRKVNAGDIRVLIGSTPKMGAGTNVQQRLVALHHLDVPWKPSDIEQREGRIIRQGNVLADTVPGFETEILAYVTQDTLDMRMWQIQETKLKMINQLRSRQIEREIENAFEDMEMSAGEMQAAATGNMDLLKEIQLRTEVQKLEKKQRAFDAGRSDLLSRIKRAKADVKRLPEAIRQADKVADAAQEAISESERFHSSFKVDINGTTYTDAREARGELRRLDEQTELAEDGKERKVKLDVTINGEQFTSRTKMAEAFARLAGDAEPFIFKADGQTFHRLADAAAAIQQEVADAVAEQDERAIGVVGGFAARIEPQMDRMNSMFVDITLDDGNGATLNAQANVSSGTTAARNTAENILRAVCSMIWGARRNAEYERSRLARAEKSLADLESVDIPASWPDAEKLERAREAHKEVLQRLNSARAEKTIEQAAGAADGEAAPKFSLSAQRQASEQVSKTVEQIRAGWTNGPGVEVVFDMSDDKVPVQARTAFTRLKASGAKGAPEGFYLDGKVYLVASSLATPADTARVLMHEALGHHGLAGVFGGDLPAMLDRLAKALPAKVAAKAEQYGLDMADPDQRRQAAEEFLAELAQTRPSSTWVGNLVATVRAWLRDHIPGFRKMALSDAEVIGDYIAPARGWVERGSGAGGAEIKFSLRADLPIDLPPSIIGASLATATTHPQYAAAKAGDRAAALKLALDLVSPGMVDSVRELIGARKPIIVPVVSVEATGRNKIPLAAAESLAAKLGLKTQTTIVQSDSPKRSNMDGLDRLFSAPEFDGPVKVGADYLLVDDTLTQGGTFASLASHIRARGGNVVGAVALTGKQYSATMRPSPELLAQIRERFQDVEPSFRAATGYGFDALTQSEARYLANFKPADTARARIVEAGRRAGERMDEGGVGSSGTRFSLLDKARAVVSGGQSGAEFFGNLAEKSRADGRLHWWHKTVGTMNHLASKSEPFRRVYDGIQDFIQDASKYATEAADLAPSILPKLDRLADILPFEVQVFGRTLGKSPMKPADAKVLSATVFHGTLLWTRDGRGRPIKVSDAEALAEGLGTDEKAHALLRAGKVSPDQVRQMQGNPLDIYDGWVRNRFEAELLRPGIVFTPAELKHHFGANDDQVKLYKQFRAAVDKSLTDLAISDMIRVAGGDVAAMAPQLMELGDAEAAAKQVADHLRELAETDVTRAGQLKDTANAILAKSDKVVDLIAKGYAPLTRFGAHKVDVVDSDGNRLYFGLFERAGEAAKMAAKMRQEYPDADVTRGTLSKREHELYAGVTPETLELFGEALGLDMQGDNASDRVFQEYLAKAKNQRSAMKRLIHRKGIAGFSEDAGRVLAGFVYSNGRQVAGNLHNRNITQAVRDIPRDEGQLKDAAISLQKYVFNPQEEAQAIRGLLFAQYLGGSIASAVVNLTQTPSVTFPYLSQWGVANAAKQIGRAMVDAGRDSTGDAQLDAALKHAEEAGIVAPQEVHQLMAQARGAASLRGSDGTLAGAAMAHGSNTLSRLGLAWGKPFSWAEQANRRIAFIAAYRTGVRVGAADPAKFAERAVNETQFVNNKGNRPEWSRGAVGATLFTFKSFSVNYLGLMNRMWTQGEPGSEGRKAGRRAVALSMLMLFLMAGADGLPGAGDAEDLLDGLLQRLGYAFSSKQAKLSFLMETLGAPEWAARFVTKGLSGLPGAPIDVSGRLGMGNLIPGTGLLPKKTDYADDVAEIAGAAGGLAKQAFQGVGALIDGAGGAVRSGNAWEALGGAGNALGAVAPVALKNLAKAAEMAKTGQYKDSRGSKVEDVDGMDVAMKAIGFQPNSVARTQEATRRVSVLNALNRQMRDSIAERWAQGIVDNDADRVKRASLMLEVWNKQNPESVIDQASLQSEIKKNVRRAKMTKEERTIMSTPKGARAEAARQLMGPAP